MYFLTGIWIDLCEIVCGVQQIVPDELEQAAMKVIRTGFGDRIHLRARVLALRGRQRAGFHFEFLKRVRKGQRQAQIIVRIIVLRAIQRIVDTAG